jgi:hypothetical protein
MMADYASGGSPAGSSDSEGSSSRFLFDPADVAGLPEELQTFYEFWRRKHRPDGLPRRSDFDPLDLKPYLGRIMILQVERSDPGRLRFRYRLYGSAIADLQRRDLTGRYVDETFSPVRYARTQRSYATVMEHGCAQFLVGRAPLGKDFIVYERILCPLRGETGDDVGFLIALFRYRH